MNANYLIIIIIIGIVLFGIFKKVNLYQAFLDGTKEGLKLTVNMFGYLLTFTFAITIFKSSGIIEDFVNLLQVKISPLIMIQSFIRPMSSSSSLSILIEIYQTEGIDSLNSIIATLIHSATDSSIYVIGFYFGILELKKNDKFYKYGILLNIIAVIVSIAIGIIVFKIKIDNF